MLSPPHSYRFDVALRVAAAIVGGYVLTALATAALATTLPMSRLNATLTATMISFALYAGIVLWVFAARSAWKAGAWIMLASVALYLLLRLRPVPLGI